MHTVEDLKASNGMYFKQIIGLIDLMLETNNLAETNLITIKDLSEKALDEIQNY